MDTRIGIAVALGALGCGGAAAGGVASSPGGVLGNAGPRARPLPECPLESQGEGYAPWDRRRDSGCRGIARAVDDGWVVLTGDAITRFDRDGRRAWESRLDHVGPDGNRCGYADGIAIDGAGRVVVSCGYSVLGFSPTGAFTYQVWPGGNHGVTPPLVDAAGTVYVGVEGALYALEPDGTTRWKVDTGFNRWFAELATNARGELVFETAMAALHSEDNGSGYRFYYEYEPPELFVVDRAGTIVSRTTRDAGADVSYPAWVDVVGEGGGRVPTP
jgi:hypothetical protein